MFGCVAIGAALALANSESDGSEQTRNGSATGAALDPPGPSGTENAAGPFQSEAYYEAEPLGFEATPISEGSQFEECIANVSRVESEPCLLAEIGRLDDAIPPATYDKIKKKCEYEATDELNSEIFRLECILFEIDRHDDQ